MIPPPRAGRDGAGRPGTVRPTLRPVPPRPCTACADGATGAGRRDRRPAKFGPPMQCTVLGAGVSGLSAAVLLLREGHAVRIVAERRTPHTTSDVPAAFFFPYGVAPSPRARRWVRASFLAFSRLADRDGTGVARRGASAVVATAGEARWWLEAMGRRVPEPGQGAASGGVRVRFPSFVVDVRRYLPWLEACVLRLGGRFDERRVTAFADVDGDVIVNCTGLGAAELAGDRQLVPARGQIVRVAGVGVDEVRVDERDPAAPVYVVPRGDDCIVGGTFEPGRRDLSPDPQQRAAILARAARFVPEVAGARVIEDRVGLRPQRPVPRVELEPAPPTGRPVVHDYGHGGAGVTLSWGCALEVRDLVRRAARAAPRPHAASMGP